MDVSLLRTLVAATTLLVLAATAAPAAPPEPPGERDRCAVCGMFVTPYPNWLASAVLSDGAVLYFDGPKDLFRYLADPGRYDARRSGAQPRELYVTEYYTTRPIAARDAFFVIGSDVLGPMGRELIPLASAADAEEFRRDHKGETVLRFDEITADILESLQ